MYAHALCMHVCPQPACVHARASKTHKAPGAHPRVPTQPEIRLSQRHLIRKHVERGVQLLPRYPPSGTGGWVSREQLDASFDVFAYEVALAETYFRLRRHSRVCAGGLVCFRCARVNTCRLRAYMHAQRMCIHSYMYIYTYNIDTYR